jgi:hypothetical protein
MIPKIDLGLPNAVKGKTYADASKHIEKMFKDRNSIIDIQTKKTFLSRLKDAQEVERQKLQEKPQQYEQTQQMQNGRYEGEEPVDWENTNVNNELANPYSNNLGTRKNWLSGTFGKEGTVPYQLNKTFGKDSWFGRNEGNNTTSIVGGVGLAASVLGPMIANRKAMKSLTPPKTINPMLMNQGQVQGNFVNRQQLLRNAAEQSSTQRHFLTQTGANWNQLMSGYSNLNANTLNSTGNLMLQADLADQQEKVRVQQGRQGIQQFNIGQQMRADETNAQNQAAYQGTMASYKQAQGANIGAVGQSLFNLMQAKKYGKYASAYEKLSNI